MKDYKFDHSGLELLHLVTMILSSCSSMYEGKLFLQDEYSLGPIVNMLSDGYVDGDKDEFYALANKVLHKSADVMGDVKKITNMLLDSEDVEGKQVLFNILKQISPAQESKMKQGALGKIYNNLLYKDGSNYRGLFRANLPEMNKNLLLRLIKDLYGYKPDYSDIETFVKNAQEFGVSDEELNQVYHQ